MEDRAQDAAKLYSPSAARNRLPVRDTLLPLLSANARVLEIGSGTGEHGETCCAARADIRWQYSERDLDSMASCAARAKEMAGLLAPVEIDASLDEWTDELSSADALVCLNVIHIAPWQVAEGLARGAQRVVAPGGFVYLYGPFKEGDATAASNLDFDASLRARNPEWGVRAQKDVEALFESCGFQFERRYRMPANNLALIFRRPV